MRALVVGAVPVPDNEAFYVALARTGDLVVAADAAAEWLLALGVRPDVAVGDFDSARPGAVERLETQGIPVVAFPAEKDETDLELAVAEARARGATGITLTAAFADRLDHTLAALGVLARAADLLGEAREPHMTGWALDGSVRPSLEVRLPAGSLLSVFAILGPVRGVSLDGLAYPLEHSMLEPLSGLGVSNVVSGPVVRVSVAEGTLVVLASKPAGT
jgi:thiamine pyrophosphokinase